MKKTLALIMLIMTVLVSCQKQQYTISTTANPSNGGTAKGGGTYKQGTSCTVQATAEFGYAFTNWTENEKIVSTDTSYTFTVNSNRNLVANFTPDGNIMVNGVSFKMIEVEGGTFNMGAQNADPNGTNYNEAAGPEEAPVHSVTLSTYYIGETEVTQALWTAVMGNNPSYYKGDNLPVEMVSWVKAQEFITKLNQLTGKQFRLPTEAEWEYAARGGKMSKGFMYSGSNTVDDVAWGLFNDYIGQTHDVKTKTPNELGLYDMSGNVWEWVEDWMVNYSAEAQTNPTGSADGTRCVNRGGCWRDDARYCRVASRSRDYPEDSSGEIGFRLAL